MKNLDFVFTTNGLEVSFRVLTKVPANSPFDWDFGDDNGSISGVKQPTYTYENSGFYPVTLKITNTDGLDLSVTKTVAVNIKAQTTLSDSIYNIINHYIPSELSLSMSSEEKALYITKWQLYIQPLVNHEIPLDKYKDELMYEALENQLIVELSAWDYLNVKLLNLLTITGEYLTKVTSTKEPEDGDFDTESVHSERIKQITTGPTEVHYYDTLANSSELFEKLSQAMKPGGIIDELRKNLCMLAERLEIYLPFCNQISTVVVPRVTNRRRAGVISGPNPGFLVKRKTIG